MSTRALIIEDNVTNMELVTYLLTAAGYGILTASDGAQGLQVARQERPDIIICDLQMPIMDGYEVLRHMKLDASLRHIPIIAVTALSMPSDRLNVHKAGFDGYISKPIDPELFVQQVEKVLLAQRN